MADVYTRRQGKLTFYYGIEQGTQEWLELRSNRATCSNAFGLCYHGKNFAKNANLQHAIRTSPNGNEYAERGHALEAEVKERIISQFTQDGSQFDVVDDCSFITHDDYPNAGYSPDAILVDKETGEFFAPIEVKCFNDITERKVQGTAMRKFIRTNKHKMCCEDPKKVPFEYRMQFQMEMLMTDTDLLLLVLYNPDAEPGVPVLKIHQIEREERYINRIRERLLEKC